MRDTSLAATAAADVPFMIAGSFASTAHGLPRATQDLNVVIDPPNTLAIDTLTATLLSDDFDVDADTARDGLRDRTMFNAIDRSGWKIDFIVRKSRPFSIVEFQRRVAVEILGVPVFVASAEDTVIAKLEWSTLAGDSERQRRDVAGVLATMGDDLDRGYIERWVRELGLVAEWSTVAGLAL